MKKNLDLPDSIFSERERHRANLNGVIKRVKNRTNSSFSERERHRAKLNGITVVWQYLLLQPQMMSVW